MNTNPKSIIKSITYTNLKLLNSKDLIDYNGGGVISEAIAWLVGAWSVHSERIQMSPEERAAFIEEHGLRDHY